MSIYEPYMARIRSGGTTPKESNDMLSEIRQVDLILTSVDRSDVKLNKEKELYPSIVSNVDKFGKRRFIFLPHTDVETGYYIEYQNYTYLATDKNNDPIYPELFAEVCNAEFPVLIKQMKYQTGTSDMGSPIWGYKDEIEMIPCVMTNQIYSALSNQPIPLPTGAMIMKIPYNPEHVIHINYAIKIRNSEYKTIDVAYQHVINEKGYVEVHLQREVDKKSER